MAGRKRLWQGILLAAVLAIILGGPQAAWAGRTVNLAEILGGAGFALAYVIASAAIIGLLTT